MIVILSTTQTFAVGVSIDGNAVNFTADSGEPFVDANNRTMVPLRITMEAAGATVEWDAATRAAGVSKDDVVVNVPIGQKYIIKNGQQIENDTAAVIIDGRTYLPIRAVLEAHGFSVDWDGGSQTVLVTTAAESEVTQATEQEQAPSASLSMVSAPSIMHRNEDVTITVTGKPNTEYRLRVFYKSESIADGLGAKTSDGSGRVSWTWQIGGKTSFGDFHATISGGGEEIRHDFTVVE
jgi:hypothetical protein